VLLDSGFFDLEVGVSTTAAPSNSSSFLIQNCKFDGVTTSIQDTGAGKVLLAGSAGEISIDSWGFGNIITGESGSATFQNGNYIPAANRSTNLLAPSSSSSRGSTQPGSFFSRSAPTYDDQSVSAFVNVKAMGARGDGVSDDAAILNQILASASNASQIVFFPYGVYAVSDTLNVPVGSRIVGQAWPAIVGTGDKFQDMANPRVVLQVGHSGSVGVIEISDMLVSVKGPAAGAVLLEWNVHESSQGSAAMWNTPLPVGGNIGSDLQAANCPSSATTPSPECIAASLLLHMTPGSSGYLENVWAWVSLSFAA